MIGTVKKDIPATITETLAQNLPPAVFKLEALRLLVVGGGSVACEQLDAILNNTRSRCVKVVAGNISSEIKKLAARFDGVELRERPYSADDLKDIDLVVCSADEKNGNTQVYNDAKLQGVLINIAGNPELSDFEIPTVIQKAPASVAGELPQIITPRRRRSTKTQKNNRRWFRIAYVCMFAAFFLLAGSVFFGYVTIADLDKGISYLDKRIDNTFYLMILTGFFAQIVDGALGMGYGVTCTSVLLAIGIPLPALSGSVHTARLFSSAAGGISHYKFGNINKKLFKLIVIPGVIGAFMGAYLLSRFGQQHASFVRPVLAVYTFFLGAKIIINVIRKRTVKKKLNRVGWLGFAGGILDSFGGGGWGTLVTSTLISKGRTPRYVIGTVGITEFFVMFTSAITFFTMIGISHWRIIAGLIIGGLIAAPIAAKLTGKIPPKTAYMIVGVMVIAWSVITLLRTIL